MLKEGSIFREPYDPSSPLAFLKAFITDELVENIVHFTNKYVDIVINDPAIQSRVAGKRSVFHLWKKTNKDQIWLYFGVCLIMGVNKSQNTICTGQGNILLLRQFLVD